MSDITTNPDSDPAEEAVDELSLLKKRASSMGLAYHPSIGVEALRKKISDHLNEVPAVTEVGPVTPMTAVEAAAKEREQILADSMKLVRLRIANLNPDKKELYGEFFTVANRVIGNVKKFVPYGDANESGYHVPHVIYEALRERKFLQVKTRKDPKRPGHMIVDQKWVPEFAIDILAPLTPAELRDLATAQAAAGRID